MNYSLRTFCSALSTNIMKTLYKRILTILLTITLIPVFACDCENAGDFLVVAKKTPVVLVVKVKQYSTFKLIQNKRTPISMEVDVIKILKGAETRSTIKIWGDDGKLCRVFLTQFRMNQTMVVALQNGNPKSGLWGEKHSDYFISDCGQYWCVADLKTKNAIVGTGQNMEQMSFDEVSERVR